MNTRYIRRLATAVIAIFVMAGLTLPATVQASEEGRRNTTLGLGALTLHLLSQGDALPALASAAGTYYAYNRWNDAIQERHEREWHSDRWYDRDDWRYDRRHDDRDRWARHDDHRYYEDRDHRRGDHIWSYDRDDDHWRR